MKVEDPILETHEVPKRYPFLKKNWLEKKRCTGGGPPFVRCGRKVGYRLSDLEAWLDENKHRTTSDPGPLAEKLAAEASGKPRAQKPPRAASHEDKRADEGAAARKRVLVHAGGST